MMFNTLFVQIVPQVLHEVLALPPTIHQAVRVMATRLVGELAMTLTAW